MHPILSLRNLRLLTDGGRNVPPFELHLDSFDVRPRKIHFVFADFTNGKGPLFSTLHLVDAAIRDGRVKLGVQNRDVVLPQKGKEPVRIESLFFSSPVQIIGIGGKPEDVAKYNSPTDILLCDQPMDGNASPMVQQAKTQQVTYLFCSDPDRVAEGIAAIAGISDASVLWLHRGQAFAGPMPFDRFLQNAPELFVRYAKQDGASPKLLSKTRDAVLCLMPHASRSGIAEDAP